MHSIYTARQHQKVSSWAGGTTTELCIFPAESTCAERNFAFRVSSATVDLAESTFSEFAGYTRHIMPLEGSMELWHDGVFASRLQPYEGHTFDGGQKTRSAGRCVDFNLIHATTLQGTLDVVRGNGCVVTCAANGHTGIYARCDELVVSVMDKGAAFTHTLHMGDFLLLHPKEEASCLAEFELKLSARCPKPVLAVIAKILGQA